MTFENTDIQTVNGSPVVQKRQGVRPAIFYMIVLLVFLSDQISKIWVQRQLDWEQTRPILGNFFSLTLTRNTGGAWGFLPHGNTLFIVFASVAVVALLFAYYRMPQVPLLVGAALALALGGAMGNLLDRLRYQYVVDFFYVHAGSFHWPIFNIADSAITVGICLLILHFFRANDEETENMLATARPKASSVGLPLTSDDAGHHPSE